MTVSTDPGRFTAQNATLKFLIQTAYHVREDQIIGGPKWLDTERYDIAATTPQQDPTAEERRAMLQHLLADRFQLQAHLESRIQNVFELTVDKGGLKIIPAEQTPVAANGKLGATVAPGRIAAQRVPLARLAEMLSTALGQTVLDRTAVPGLFDFKVEWAPDESQPMLSKPGALPPAAESANGPSIFTALREQLGLKLESRKAPVELLVIDRAELPSAN